MLLYNNTYALLFYTAMGWTSGIRLPEGKGKGFSVLDIASTPDLVSFSGSKAGRS